MCLFNNRIVSTAECSVQTKGVFTEAEEMSEVAQSSSRACDLLSSVNEPKSSGLKQNKYINLKNEVAQAVIH